MKLGSYHILFVPKDPSKTRRLELSTLTARLVALVAVLIVPVIVTALASTVRSQNKVENLEAARMQDKFLLEQKDLLMSRMMGLERSLSRTVQSVQDLKETFDGSVGQMKAGVGPIDDDALLQVASKEVPHSHTLEALAFEEDEDLSVTQYHQRMNHLDERIAELKSEAEMLNLIHEDKLKFLAFMPNVMPVAGWVTSGFGFRQSPYSRVYKMHNGMDIASPSGSIIRAPAAGKVMIAEYKGGYGRKIVLDHGYGISTVYAHASELLVEEGTKVQRGDPIATVGTSGASTGPHLHYEVHVDGVPTDPVQYLVQ